MQTMTDARTTTQACRTVRAGARPIILGIILYSPKSAHPESGSWGPKDGASAHMTTLCCARQLEASQHAAKSCELL